MSQDDAEDLVYAVVTALLQREKQLRKPFLLFVEEIHEYIPQTGGVDELGERLLQVAKRGRKHGLGMVGMSQRPAAVDKNFITQCNWLVWHRLTWDNDTDVVDRIIGSEAAAAVPDLSAGRRSS
ncbi:hypothetical protein VB773_01780 [Haloarculaceae archaeon H-GB2-1]|nr:hypothetical protein [Haloarculaceae archaeon H-GB2-1]